MNATPRRRRWRSIVRGIGVVGLVLFGVLLTVRLVWGYVEARRMNATIASIQAAGEPITFKDLDRGQPKINEADDAGPCYEAALALIRDKDDEKLWDAWSAYLDLVRNTPTSRPSDSVAARINRLLSDNEPVLELLDRGSALPQCSFDIGIERGMGFCLERLSRTRAAAKLLWLRALVHAEKDEGDQAVDSAIALLRFSRVFDRRPLIIVYLVKIACVSLACTETGSLIALSQPSEQAWTRLSAAFKASEALELKRVLLAERVYALQLMREVVENPGLRMQDSAADMPAQFSRGGWISRPFVQRMAGSTLGDFAEFIRLTDKTPAESLKPMKDIASAQAAHLLTLPMERIFVQAALMSAQVRSAELAIAIERFRRTHKQLPSSLAELVPQYVPSLPTDPFTDKDLIYRHDAAGFVVYSVGENGIDDGALITQQKGKGGLPDAGVRVPRLIRRDSVPASSIPSSALAAPIRR